MSWDNKTLKQLIKEDLEVSYQEGDFIAESIDESVQKESEDAYSTELGDYDISKYNEDDLYE